MPQRSLRGTGLMCVCVSVWQAPEGEVGAVPKCEADKHSPK